MAESDAGLPRPDRRPYVLDDGPIRRGTPRLAAEFGYSATASRPNPASIKKAGNLRHAFGRTCGEFIVILDADFAPRSDFLAETLPYFDDAADRRSCRHRSSSATQQAADLGGTAGRRDPGGLLPRRSRWPGTGSAPSICVGTSAVYRRAALEPQGGPTLIPYAEDVHTGLDVRRDGWTVIYVPVLLVGRDLPGQPRRLRPPAVPVVHRQRRHRCSPAGCGRVPMTRARSAYLHVRLLLLRLHGALAFFGPLIPIFLLVFLPAHVRLCNFMILLPGACVSRLRAVPAVAPRPGTGPSVWAAAASRAAGRTSSPSGTAPGQDHELASVPARRAARCAGSGSG